MLICVPLVVALISIHEQYGGNLAHYILKFWGKLFSFLSGIVYEKQGDELLNPHKSYIFTANHQSFFDSPAMVYAIPGQFRALGKQEILHYPVFGFLFRYIGVTVDRTSIISKKHSFEQIRSKLEQKMHILIFPEGHMNTTNKTLLRFYDGAFRLAIETQSPIVPTAILNSKNIMPRKKNMLLQSGKIVIQIAPPIETKGMDLTQIKMLREQVRTKIEQMIVAFEEDEFTKITNGKS